jgi:hypothetical protein
MAVGDTHTSTATKFLAPSFLDYCGWSYSPQTFLYSEENSHKELQAVTAKLHDQFSYDSKTNDLVMSIPVVHGLLYQQRVSIIATSATWENFVLIITVLDYNSDYILLISKIWSLIQHTGKVDNRCYLCWWASMVWQQHRKQYNIRHICQCH